jgi:diguanylate cyclase (GGDEF)-like protein
MGPGDDTPYLLSQLQDTSARKSHERELDYLAHHDVLTGVLNRRGLTRELARQAELARMHGLAGSVLVCDVDRFKQVNDELGHEAGDELLVDVARALEQVVRASDVVGRLGGDEFAVILPSEDLAGARSVAEQIGRRLEATRPGRRWSDLPVALSIGAAEFRAGHSVDQVLSEADRAMYAVKASHRG